MSGSPTIRVLDLHGNRRDVLRGRRDDNVFPPVKVGIAITLLVRRAEPTEGRARVFYRDARGTAEQKFAYLAAASVTDDGWTEVRPQAPRYTFLPRDHSDHYAAWPALDALMPERSPGVISHRDPLSVAFTADELLAQIREFADLAIPDNEVKERYSLAENDRWVLHRRRVALGDIVDGNRVKALMFRCTGRPSPRRTCSMRRCSRGSADSRWAGLRDWGHGPDEDGRYQDAWLSDWLSNP